MAAPDRRTPRLLHVRWRSLAALSAVEGVVVAERAAHGVAWFSLVWVAFTDFYIYLVATGTSQISTPGVHASSSSFVVATVLPSTLSAHPQDGSTDRWQRGVRRRTVPRLVRTESLTALERRCGSSSLGASAAAEAVRKAGWVPFLHFDRAIARDDIEILGGMTAASPGCEPTTFNLFVFVGRTFAGTISPIVMGQGRDGVVGAVPRHRSGCGDCRVRAYTTKDTECCPTSRVRVTYRIERAGPQRTLVPVDIRTLR